MYHTPTSCKSVKTVMLIANVDKLSKLYFPSLLIAFSFAALWLALLRSLKVKRSFQTKLLRMLNSTAIPFAAITATKGLVSAEASNNRFKSESTRRFTTTPLAPTRANFSSVKLFPIVLFGDLIRSKTDDFCKKLSSPLGSDELVCEMMGLKSFRTQSMSNSNKNNVCRIPLLRNGMLRH
jgi:hypothetical protein